MILFCRQNITFDHYIIYMEKSTDFYTHTHRVNFYAKKLAEEAVIFVSVFFFFFFFFCIDRPISILVLVFKF